MNPPAPRLLILAHARHESATPTSKLVCSSVLPFVTYKPMVTLFWFVDTLQNDLKNKVRIFTDR